MKSYQRYFSVCLLALFAPAAFGQAPDMGDALDFAVLGGTNVTCTAGVVTGDIGVSPGSAVPFTNTGCVITGDTPPATNRAAARARADFLSAYDDARALPCPSGNVLLSTITGPVTLLPGVYCTGAALTGAGKLTLDAQGDPDAVWVFQIGTAATGALTGTNFNVLMSNGGLASNVWWVAGSATMTDSTFVGSMLAGGTITVTRGSFHGDAWATAAVVLDATILKGR